ncbi:DUF5103 domain-containing protein [Dysgonomonas sp. 520]|uniref:type IX secretion system plug protein n=1 Tax=Dysgonomonas sp. 520 TaxID=2302931 RepID=UPI0013D61C02|nr:DUF5103 domain-containing protein [Dysgonomonas sp. 520]NDW09097.1 DUF5103 domain-containing protein [Dysgonomonas sp. 520]
MKHKIILIIIINLLCLNIIAQVYKTQPTNSEIHTIQVKANDNWLKYPVIELNSSDYITINFDRLGDNASDRLRYKLIHCNADWRPSSLSDIEYLNGFNDNLIEDYALSMRTTVEYTNFQFQLPNDDVRLLQSGNYAVQVYEEDDYSNVLLTACFSVVDTQVKINATVSSITDIDANKEHQQVSFDISKQSIRLNDPFSELKIYVRQNDRLDNERKLLKPTYIQADKLIYEHNRELVFEAGNEYRRFESLSYRYNGLNIEKTTFINPFYYTFLYPDKVRSGKTYSYDEDKNGRFLIRNGESGEPDTEADYFVTTFTLPMEYPLIEPVYLNGNFSYNTFSDKYLMKYDDMEKQYKTSLLLKQGAYNYQYLTKLGNKFSTQKVEGNNYETENEYSIMIYFRPQGQRHDSLVGFLTVKK